MTFGDCTLIGKKVLVGILVTLIPLVILVGGLRLTRRVLATSAHANSSQGSK